MLIETIEGLDDETQKIILLQLKLDIESVYHGHHVLTKGWEKMRYNNIQNYEKVTVRGECEVCEAEYPFQMNTIEFLKLPYLYVYFEKHSKQVLNEIQKLDCLSCKERGSVRITPRWHIFEDGHYEISSEDLKDYGV